MNRSNKGLEVALVLTALAYVSFFPFTKVEESFSLHAIRDFLSYPQVTLAQVSPALSLMRLKSS